MSAELHTFIHTIESIERDGGKIKGKIPLPFRKVGESIALVYEDRVEIRMMLEIDPKKLKPDA